MAGQRSNAGFTLVGVLVLVAVVNILLAVAMTSWLRLDRRAKEAELIWRGQQIARALSCFQRESGGPLPETLDEVVEVGCLRRIYGDPMAADGQWRILTEQDVLDGTVAQLGGATPAEPGAFPAPAGTVSSRSGGDREAGSAASSAPGGGSNEIRVRLQLRGSNAEASSRLGIVGVSSWAEGEASRRYQDRTRYAEWLFLVPQGR